MVARGNDRKRLIKGIVMGLVATAGVICLLNLIYMIYYKLTMCFINWWVAAW
jgi:hypothetical protein